MFPGVVGGEEVDGVIAWVDALEVWVVELLEEEVFIADVAGDVVEPQPKRPAVDGVAKREADVVVGVDEGAGVALDGAAVSDPFEEGPYGGFDIDLEIGAPRPDAVPAVDGEDFTERC